MYDVSKFRDVIYRAES